MDLEKLRKQLERATSITNETGGSILVITEGVFGMAGDLGKLKEICELKNHFELSSNFLMPMKDDFFAPNIQDYLSNFVLDKDLILNHKVLRKGR